MARYLLIGAVLGLVVPVFLATLFAFPWVTENSTAFFAYVSSAFALASTGLDLWGSVLPVQMIKTIMLFALGIVVIITLMRILFWLTNMFTGSKP